MIENQRLAALTLVKDAIERISTFGWTVTSWKRNSPSHYDGSALDVAPRPTGDTDYGHYKGMDPFLNMRFEFIKRLVSGLKRAEPDLRLAMLSAHPGLKGVVVVVESNHIHIQLLENAIPPQFLTIKRLMRPRGDAIYPTSTCQWERLQTIAESRGNRGMLSNNQIRKARTMDNYPTVQELRSVKNLMGDPLTDLVRQVAREMHKGQRVSLAGTLFLKPPMGPTTSSAISGTSEPTSGSSVPQSSGSIVQSATNAVVKAGSSIVDLLKSLAGDPLSAGHPDIQLFGFHELSHFNPTLAESVLQLPAVVDQSARSYQSESGEIGDLLTDVLGVIRNTIGRKYLGTPVNDYRIIKEQIVDPLAATLSKQFGYKPHAVAAILLATIYNESSFNLKVARGSSGEYGIWQAMPFNVEAAEKAYGFKYEQGNIQHELMLGRWLWTTFLTQVRKFADFSSGKPRLTEKLWPNNPERRTALQAKLDALPWTGTYLDELILAAFIYKAGWKVAGYKWSEAEVAEIMDRRIPDFITFMARVKLDPEHQIKSSIIDAASGLINKVWTGLFG